MIKVKNLRHKYRGAKEAVLQGVDFEVKSGQIVAIVGKNGSGKSTLGKLVAGILRPEKGAVQIDGLDAHEKQYREKIFRKVGIVFQNPENQIIFSNVRDEIAFAVRGLDAAEINIRIKAALEMTGMSGYEAANLYDLSLGQKQRIILAEALVRQPDYLVLDEPTAMIDSDGKAKIHAVIRRLAKGGMGILLITNSAEELLLADKVLFLEDGKIVDTIKKSDLMERAEVFEQHGIARPLLVDVAGALKAQGMDLKMRQWTVDELVQGLKKYAR